MDFVQKQFNTNLSGKDIALMGAGAACWDKPLAQIESIETFVKDTGDKIYQQFFAASEGQEASKLDPLLVQKVLAARVYVEVNRRFAGNKAWANKAITGILVDVSKDVMSTYLRPMISGSLAGKSPDIAKEPSVPAGMSNELAAALSEVSGGM